MIKQFVTFKIVLDVLRSYKLRTALAIMGVLLGTFAVVLVTSLTISLENKVKQEINKFGENVITVAAGRIRRRSSSEVIFQSTRLKVRDAQDIVDEVPGVKTAVGFTNRSSTVSRGDVAVSTTIYGTSPEGFDVKKLTLAEGALFTNDDMEKMERKCVLGSDVTENLFKGEDPVGKIITIYNLPFRVTGVLESMGGDPAGASLDNMVVIPLTTHVERMSDGDSVDGILVQMYSFDNEPDVVQGITSVLRRNHKIHNDEDDFDIISPKDIMEMRTKSLSIVSFLGNITAAVSYLIGGLGIFSIMLLIVGQRRQEVGIRRAVGAREKDIMNQFLTESAFIGFSGGVLGGLAGIVVCNIVFAFGVLPAAFSVPGAAVAFGSSLVIGILAGAYPAKLAASVNPVDTLR